MTVTATDVTSLDHASTGRWLVTTRASRYEIDLDAATVLRFPGEGTGEAEVGRWNDDDKQMSLNLLQQCEVGERMRLIVDFSQLSSTAVVSITPMD